MPIHACRAKPAYTNTKYFNFALRLEQLYKIALSDQIVKAYLENIRNIFSDCSEHESIKPFIKSTDRANRAQIKQSFRGLCHAHFKDISERSTECLSNISMFYFLTLLNKFFLLRSLQTHTRPAYMIKANLKFNRNVVISYLCLCFC